MPEKSSAAGDSAAVSWWVRLLRTLGPAIIVASVVLGPGSILANSQVGARFGYGMIWVLLLAVMLMIGTTALAARLGISLRRTPCEELAARLGRPAAVLLGLAVFAICSCFQFTNNLGVLAAVQPAITPERAGRWQTWLPFLDAEIAWQVLLLLALNGLLIGTLFGLKHLYKPVERLMMLLVLLMLIAFAVNLGFARPSPTAMLAGMVPRLPAAEGLPAALLPLVAMIGTTFSVAGAYYQAYLVREKGWGEAQLRRGLTDSIAGISVLGVVSLMIMVTSAAVLHGRVGAGELQSLGDVAAQLEPLFGRGAVVLFSLGIFAGAFSSFLVNAMIGGTMLSDGLGLGGRMDGRWPRLFTVAALLVGMAVAVALRTTGWQPVTVIVIGQALTVLAAPAVAAALLYLGSRRTESGARAVPGWLQAVGLLALLTTLLVASRLIVTIHATLTGG